MNTYLANLQTNEATKAYQTHNINYLRMFGSTARGEDNKDSDVDLLVDFSKTKTLFDLANIQFYFENLLDKKVDLVTRKGLKKQLEPYIKRDLITIYEQN